MKKGLHVTAARPAQPTLWTAKLDRFKGSKHHTTLITCRRVGDTGPDSRCAVPYPWGRGGTAGSAAVVDSFGEPGEGGWLCILHLYPHVRRHRNKVLFIQPSFMQTQGQVPVSLALQPSIAT